MDLGGRCEQQMTSHQQRFPGMLEQIGRSQDKLIPLIHEAFRNSSVDFFESRAPAIIQTAFPNSAWPADLEPWPSSRISLANIHSANGKYLDALKYSVSGYLRLEPRSGDKWIRHLSNLVELFICVLNNGPVPVQSERPNHTQLVSITYGYLREVAASARVTFGETSGYARALQARHAEFAGKISAAPVAMNRALFDQAQTKLLLWCGVDEGRGLELTF